MKLLYGDYNFCQYLQSTGEDFVIFNYSGMREDIPQLGLLPPNTLGAVDEIDFDMRYMSTLLENKECFLRLMMMVECLHNGMSVYLVMSDDPWTNMVSESFLKFLQSRYGLIGCHIGSIEDLQYAEDTDFDPYQGIRRFDADYMTYMDIKETIRIQNGGRPAYD